MTESIYKDDIAQYMAMLKKAAPDLNSKWIDYHNIVFEEGLISKKDKQLIALGCAHMTSCPYCIRSRTKLAKASGATDEEIAETVFIAMRLSMGQPYAYSSIALENFDKMQNKEDTTDGFFFSKNITPQITDFHELSGEKHEKFSAFLYKRWYQRRCYKRRNFRSYKYRYGHGCRSGLGSCRNNNGNMFKL